INDKLFEVVSVNGPSMNPSLSPTYHETGERDYLLLRKWNPTGNLKRGDVISLYTPHKPEVLGIKRVIGVEGDWVWHLMGDMHDRDSSKRRIMVPQGHVWVEGDNWRKSRDSNWYGPISKSLINGKAVCIILPFTR
ncbi:peptidase S24/S26A/S26B/S26C, partial [Delphinella strobiligena]